MIPTGKDANEQRPILGTHIGHIIDGNADTPHTAALLTASEDQILLELSILEGVNEEYRIWQSNPPEQVHFFNADRRFALYGIQCIGSRDQLVSRLMRLTCEVNVLVESRADCTLLHGLSSDLQGLPGWASIGMFSFELEKDNSGQQVSLTYKMTNRPNISITGVEGLSIAPHYGGTVSASSGQYNMSESVRIESRFNEPQQWHVHTRIHRAMQDLVSLAYWFPCNQTAVQSLRDEDKVVTPNGMKLADGWKRIIVPDFGRRGRSSPIRRLGADSEPLFNFSDIGVEGVAKWFDEYDDLGKSMWILSTSLFREGGTVEVRLFQVAMALEALGYHLATSNRQRSANFEPTLMRVVQNTDCSLEKVLKGSTAAEWAAAFNRAYLGVKHADNDLPPGLDAHERAEEGALLARLWLARHLGVERDKLEQRLERL